MKKHLAVFPKESINQIFNGKKTVELRVSKKRIPPYGVVSKGDIVYIKPSGRDLVGQFRAKKVVFFEGLETGDFEIIQKLGIEVEFRKGRCEFGSVIFMDKIEQFITSPLKISKKNNKTWVVLGDILRARS